MNSPKKAAGNPKKYFRIRDKILIAFLAVSLVAVGIISVFALQNMSMVGNTARANSIKLGETAVAESVAALEESGRKIIQLKAQVVAKDFQIFLEHNAGQPEEESVSNQRITVNTLRTQKCAGPHQQNLHADSVCQFHRY